jgi:hypothetical protein
MELNVSLTGAPNDLRSARAATSYALMLHLKAGLTVNSYS